MKENTGFTERRKHTRTSVKNIIVGVINSNEPEIIGSITDISLGGVKFTYHGLRKAPLKHPIHSIDFILDNNHLFDIPCDYAWNKRVGPEVDYELTDIRQYGIQFGKLTSSQSFLLKSIIASCIPERHHK